MRPNTQIPFYGVLRVCSMVLLILLSVIATQAQTTLYSETFTATNGTTQGTDNPPKWTRDISGTSPTHFDVQGNLLTCEDIDGEAEFYTMVIPIYGWSSVNASVYLPGVDKMEADDYIRIYYKLNGGAETIFPTNGNLADDYSSRTASVSGLSGNTLQIVIRIDNDNTDENHDIDNITVTGTNNAIYSEPFTYSNGTTTSSKWTISSTGASPTVFSVQGNRFEQVDADATVVWTSSSINISGCMAVSASVDISESGNMDSDDNIRVYYKLDGGSEILFTTNGSKYDDFSSATATVSGLSGSSLQIVIRSDNDATDEHHYWDNVEVTGSCGAGLTVSNTGTDIPSCSGSNTGAINLTVSGGQTPYTITWSNASTNEDLTGLAAGTYTVTVTDNAGRTATSSRTITKPAALTPTATVTSNFNGAHISCSGSTNGAISLAVTGGKTSYSYLWNGGSTSQNRSNLGAGTYTVTVTDADGCTASTSRTITAPTALGTSFISTSPTCPNSTNGSINLTVTGGTGTKTYLWSNGATTEDLSNLIPDDYVVTVTDANGCTTSNTRVLNPTYNITSTMTITHVTTPGGTNGAISQTVGGGTAPYTYLWSNGATTKDLTNLAADGYMVTITDANSCVLNKAATVVEKTTLYCENFAYADGTTTSSTWTQSCASCSATGTSGDWEVISGAWRADDLDAVGTWTSSVIDISGYANVTASVNVAEVGTMQGDDYVRVYYKVNGGANTYFGTNGNNSNNFTSVTASQAGLEGLTLQIVIQVNNNNGVGVYHTFDNVCVTGELALDLVVDQTNVSCNGGSNGAIDLTVNNFSAVPPFTYAWNTGATTQDLTGRSAGTYTVTVTDATGIKETETVTITQPAALSGSISKTNATCPASTNGAANLTPSGGTAPRTFLWSNGITSEDLTGLKTGTYTVTITDSKGCTATTNTTITSTSNINSTFTVTNVTTPGGTNGAIAHTVTGASGATTYLWSHGATTEDLTNLSMGTYTVTVTDAAGCTKTKTTMVLDPESIYCQTFTGISNGTTTSSQWSQSCNSCSANNWDVQSEQWSAYDLDSVGVWSSSVISISGYSSVRASVSLSETDDLEASDYIRVYYKLNGGSETLFSTNGNMTNDFGSVTASHTGLTGSTLQIVIRVRNDSERHYFDNVCVYGYPAFYLETEKTDLVCKGGSNGAIDLTVTNGTGTLPFTYHWSNGATTEDLSGIAGGTYTVTVTDNGGTARTTSVTITEPATALTVDNSIVHVTCHGGSDATIVLSVGGGTSPYSFLWSNGNTSMNPSGLSAGTYTVTVSDGGGCVAEHSYVVSSPTLPMDITYTGSVDVCTGKTTQITFYGAQYYSWTPPLGLSSDDVGNPVINPTATTTYYVTGSSPGAANLVANGDFESGNIGFTTQYSYTTSNLTPEGRYGIGTNAHTYHSNFYGTDHTSGSGKFMIINGATTLNMEVWCQNLNVQPGATYSFSTWISSVHPSNPAQLEFSINNSLLGTPITAPNVRYQWNEFTAYWECDTSAARFCIVNRNTVAGGNDFALDDIAIMPNCMDVDTITVVVNDLPPVVADANGGPNQNICYGSTAELEAGGGVSYAWSNGVNTAANNVSPTSNTSYTVTVTDSHGCSASDTVDVVVYGQLLPVITSYQDVVCGVNNASIDLSVSGGTPPYTYLWSNGPTTQDISSLSAATYTVTVTDAHGCSATKSQVISPSSGISINMTKTDIACNNMANGAVNTAPSGGTAPYTYLWSTGATTQDISGLAAGTYTVTVTGANGCSATDSRTVVNPAVITPTAAVTDITCNGLTNGILDVSVSGGWSPYTYAWNGGATTQDRTSLSVGTYTVTVTDSRGCTATLSRSIAQPAVLGSSFVVTDNICHGGSNGVLDLSVTGGTAPYLYAWSNGAMTQDLTNKIADEYWVTITDARNCIRVDSAIITQPAAAILVGLDIENVSCGGVNDGAVHISATGGVAPYTYTALKGNLPAPVDSSSALQIESVSESITSLTPMAIRIIVTDSLGCKAGMDGEVGSDGPVLSHSQTNISCNGGSTGAINLTASGEGPFTYNWSTGAGTEDLSNLAAGTYTVTVTDVHACSGVKSVTITQPAFSATVTPTNATCPYSTNGSATVSSVSGGIAPITYAWSTGTTGQTITNRATGTYTVTLTDAAGCTISANTTIAAQSNISPSVFVIDATTHGGSNGSITQTLSGGLAPYSYAWSTGATSQNLTNVSIGTYTVTITDARNCSVSYSRFVSEPGACPCRWLGTVNDKWNHAANWDCGYVPTDTCHAVIRAAANTCTIQTGSAKCRDLIIEAGVSLIFNGAAKIEVHGDLVNNGNISFGTGTVEFKGNTEQNIGGSNVSKFYNLTINNSSATGVQMARSVEIANELKLMDGYLFAGSDTVKMMSNQHHKLDVYSKNSFVVGKMYRKISNTANVPYDFPVGDAGAQSRYFRATVHSFALLGTTSLTVWFDSLKQHSDETMITAMYNPPQNMNNYYNYNVPYVRIANGDTTTTDAFGNTTTVVNGVMGDMPGTMLNTSTSYLNNVFNLEKTAEVDGILYTHMATEGVWHFEPDQQPTGGFYHMLLGTENFSGLVDNDFGVLKRPTGSGARYWSGGGGVMRPFGGNGRKVIDGLASRMYLTTFSEGGVGSGGGGGLPIELLSFDAKLVGDDVDITWATATEVNNDYFTIEKSNGTEFKEIAIVPGAGNSSETKYYSEIDKEPFAGTSYYRLKQTDYDGKFTYSNVVAVTYLPLNLIEEDDKLIVVPNPSEGNFSVIVKNATEVKLNIFDNGGKLIKTEAFTSEGDEYTYPISLQDVPGGVYILKADIGEDHYTQKLMIYR